MLFFAGVGVAVGLVAAVAVYFILSASLQRREPGCGRCGYAARGLASFTCPECGADLREVGIHRDAQSNKPILMALATGLFLAGAIIIVGGWLSL